MIDYYETKAHPITRKMVMDAYVKIKDNGRGTGVDGVSLSEYAMNLESNLYKLWNRLTSGSYFPQMTREKLIPKKGGGKRSLGIATVEDRIAQQVVRAYIEPKMEGSFHDDSYGYRPGRHAHDAITKATSRCFTHNWLLDIDIKGYFDSIDHGLLLNAVRKYTEERWVLLYIKRWLKAGTLKEDGSMEERHEGTAQGSVLSPLLSNVFLHFVFDKWMELHYPRVRFERYSDDIVVHCKSEKQALFLKGKIVERFMSCRLTINEEKTRVVFCKNPNNKGERKHHHESFAFLGFTYKPRLMKTQNGMLLLCMPVMSSKSKRSVLSQLKSMRLHKQQLSLREVARTVNEKVRGWFGYYCKIEKWSTRLVWWHPNRKLLKWVMWKRGFGFQRALGWPQLTYKAQPGLFKHWELVKP
jgi:Retron-type reverse transcriptase